MATQMDRILIIRTNRFDYILCYHTDYPYENSISLPHPISQSITALQSFSNKPQV